MAVNHSSMAQRNDADWIAEIASGSGQPRETSGREETTEHIHIRNYDHQWGYDLDIVVATPDGEPVVRKHYYLQPGQAVSERDLLSSAEYELHVTLDNSHEARLPCRISSATEHTAVIEVGNGVLSLTEGLQS
jgi:hypothetical protein